MATATFNTIPAEQTTLVAPKKTTVSWKGRVIGAVMAVVVVAAASMTLYETPPTTMEMDSRYNNCNMWGMKWQCEKGSYDKCVIDTSGRPKCADDVVGPARDPAGPRSERTNYNTCHRGVFSWDCVKGAYEYCALTTSGKHICVDDIVDPV